MKVDDIVSELVAAGWREYPDRFKLGARPFFKRFDTPTRCAHNESKRGQQVGIYVWDLRGEASMELDLCGGLLDGTSVKLQNYGLGKTVPEVLALIPRLLSTWEHMANFKTEGEG